MKYSNIVKISIFICLSTFITGMHKDLTVMMQSSEFCTCILKQKMITIDLYFLYLFTSYSSFFFSFFFLHTTWYQRLKAECTAHGTTLHLTKKPTLHYESWTHCNYNVYIIKVLFLCMSKILHYIRKIALIFKKTTV